MNKNEPVITIDGVKHIFVDDGTEDGYYVPQDNLAQHICDVGGGENLTEIIMMWKANNPDGTMEEFCEESYLPEDVVEEHWDYC